MKIEKRNLVEIQFSDSEVEILQEARNVIIDLINSTDGNLLVDQRTGECFGRAVLKNMADTLENLAYNDYSTWLFEMD